MDNKKLVLIVLVLLGVVVVLIAYLNYSSNKKNSLPIIYYKNQEVPYGLTSNIIGYSPTYTGYIVNMDRQEGGLIIEVENPVSKSILGNEKQTFHFKTDFLIAFIELQDEEKTTWIKISPKNVSSHLRVGQYVSIKLNNANNIQNVSDIPKNEVNINKSIMVYKYVK